MSFCIWGPVTEILFQAMEFILPLNTLHPRKGQKQASKEQEGPDPHCQPTTPNFCSAVRTGTDKVREFSAKYIQYFGSFLQAIGGPWVSFAWAEWTHHLRKLSSQQHEGAWAPYAKVLPLLPRVRPRCSLGWCYQPRLVSYDTCHAHHGSKDKRMLRNFCVLMSLR